VVLVVQSLHTLGGGARNEGSGHWGSDVNLVTREVHNRLLDKLLTFAAATSTQTSCSQRMPSTSAVMEAPDTDATVVNFASQPVLLSLRGVPK
jgi:hypothetical protein